MTTQAKRPIKNTELRKPENFDLKKARTAVLRIIQENKEWVREMAKK